MFAAARPARRAPRRAAATVAGVVALATVAAGCTSAADEEPVGTTGADAAPSAESSPTEKPTSAASVRSNIKNAKDVKVSKLVTLTAENGTLQRVTVRAGKKKLAGGLSQDRSTWKAQGRLEPGTRYQVVATAVDDDGVAMTEKSAFRTDDLTLDEQTFPSFAPLEGSTVGVGMPVIVRFDIPVENKRRIEKHLSVKNSANQQGAWRWISDNEVHWRPRTYWKPGTKVTVNADINSVDAGNGIYGQKSRTSTFRIGDSVVSKVNADTHQMKTFINGKLARTTPITTGKPGFTTRSGVKVIIEKFRTKRMNSETVGISRDDPEAYDIDDVEYAMRVTYSGEFLHAAPWSVGSQGYANVSHGCTGMSTANAEWIYNISKPGDVVEYVGTDRGMTLENGYGDWNLPFKDWKQGSALS